MLRFLTQDEAETSLSDLHIKTANCTKSHTGHIVPFTAQQILILRQLVTGLRATLSRAGFVPGDLALAKLDDGVYWGMPFTWGKETIVLNNKFFSHPQKKMQHILTHEWVHLDQRRRPEAYIQYYRSLGFRRARPKYGHYQPLLLSNPDAEHYEWIWTGPSGRSYAPFAIMRDCKVSTLLMSDDGTVHKVESVEEYWSYFGNKRQLYHPNEISAHIIADSLKTLSLLK